MIKKQIYPITTPSQVVKVKDPTNNKTDQNLATVLQNIADSYAVGETTNDDWENHGELGGVTVQTDLKENLTALQVLQKILQPTWYPWVTGKNSFDISANKNTSFLLGTEARNVGDFTPAYSYITFNWYNRLNYKNPVSAPYLVNAQSRLAFITTAERVDHRGYDYKYKARVLMYPSNSGPLTTTMGEVTALVATQPQLMTGTSNYLGTLVDTNGYLHETVVETTEKVLYTGYKPDFIVCSTDGTNITYNCLFGNNKYEPTITLTFQRPNSNDYDVILYSLKPLPTSQNLTTVSHIKGDAGGNWISISVTPVDVNNPTETFGVKNNQWQPVADNDNTASYKTTYYKYYVAKGLLNQQYKIQLTTS